jgi:hypothetical protein
VTWDALGPVGNVIPFRDNEGLREAAIVNYEFWHARPELRAIYENSRRLMTAPWAMLGVALMRALHTIPYTVQYQSVLGPSPLNAMLVLVGDSGGGKSLLARQVDHVLPFIGGPRGLVEFTPIEVGSGEAIAEQFAHTLDKDDVARGLFRGDLDWFNRDHAVMFGFDEIGRMMKLGQRDSSTIYEYMKSGISGEALGRKLVARNGVLLRQGSYRMTVIANAQPARCGPLFTEDEIAGGFPGRILWLQTKDPGAVAEFDPSELEPLQVKSIDWSPHKRIRALPEMDEAHLEDRRRYHLEDRDPLDGHTLLTKAKIAIGLMRLNSRVTLQYEDWAMAQVVLDESVRVRTQIMHQVAETVAQEDRRRGQAAARQAAAQEDATTTMTINRIVRLLAGYAGEGKPENMWRRSLPNRDREFYDQALLAYKGW